MRLRTFALFALLALVPTAPADDKVKAPTLVLRVKAVNDLLADARWMAEQAGRDEELKQAINLIKRQAEGKGGLDGLDLSKPMAVYGYLGPQGVDSVAVLMLPVADKDTLLATLKRFEIDTSKVKDGIYEAMPQGAKEPVFYRFGNGYVYATNRVADAIRHKLPEPATVFGDMKDMLALSLDLSEVTAEMRKLAVASLSTQTANLKEKKPGETQAQADFRGAALEDALGVFKSLLSDNGVLTARLGVDRQASTVNLSLGLAGGKDTTLARSIAALGQTRSVAGAAVGTGSALAGRLTLELPQETRKSLAPVIDDGVEKAVAGVKDNDILAPLEAVIKAVAPTLKQGRLDVGVDVRGPSDKNTFTVIGVVGIRAGQNLEKQLKAAFQKLPEAIAQQLTFDTAKSGDVNIHKTNVLGLVLDRQQRKQLGDDVLYLAIRDDALFLALGHNALAALKDAVKVPAATGPLLQFDLSWKQLASLLAAQQKGAPAAAEEAFKTRGSDRTTLAVEGGEELRVRMSVQGAVLRFFALLNAAATEQ